MSCRVKSSYAKFLWLCSLANNNELIVQGVTFQEDALLMICNCLSSIALDYITSVWIRKYIADIFSSHFFLHMFVFDSSSFELYFLQYKCQIQIVPSFLNLSVVFFCEFPKRHVLWALNSIFSLLHFVLKYFVIFISCSSNVTKLSGKKPIILMVCNVWFLWVLSNRNSKGKTYIYTFYQATTFVNPFSCHFALDWSEKKIVIF